METPIETTPTIRRGLRRPALVGVVVGALATAGSVVGIGALAGAQDAPEPTPEKADATAGGFRVAGIVVDGAEIGGSGDEDWAAFEECMADQLGDLWLEPVEIEAFEEFPGDIDEFPPFDEATGQSFKDADAACNDLLPEDIRAEMAAFEEFDVCLAEQLGDLDGPAVGTVGFGTVVHVETPGGFEMIEFGEADGTVTITGNAEGVTVSTDGDVTVIDEAAMEAEWAEFDAAHEACEQLLPDDLFFGARS